MMDNQENLVDIVQDLPAEENRREDFMAAMNRALLIN